MLAGDLLSALDSRYPFAGAGDWDPVGLQVGGVTRSADRVGVCHEVTSPVVDSAIDSGIECLVTYHPLIFTPTTSLVDGSTAEGIALKLAEHGISLVVVHTALDVAQPGTADAFLHELGLVSAESFAPVDEYGGGDIGRIGYLNDPLTFNEVVSKVSAVVGGPVRTSSRHPQLVESIAVVPGSGGGFAEAAAGLADVYISGDIGHHDANQAIAHGVAVIDAGHAPSERPGVRGLYAAVCEMSPTATMLGDDPHPWEG